MEDLMNEKQVHQRLGVSLACLRRWRLLGQGPEFVKIGTMVRYRPEAIAAWIEAQPIGGNGRKPVARAAEVRRLSASA